MHLFSQLLFKMSSYCRCRIINGPDQQPYLERYHLLRLPFGYQVYLHRFVASDPGRGLHNHPWHHAASLVLSGHYEETRMSNARHENILVKKKLGAGSINCIKGNIFHRINLPASSECWTLFVHSTSAKSWGFLQQEQHHYAFHDHNQVVQQISNPAWWKTACRPMHCPQMRKPVV
ncbi:MAG: hypothetical protein GY770_15615 [Aestuariibacter sp.]|nr:hypothetical protein [Aestuariibacter sp.]